MEVEASRQDFSERLGEWVGVFDAIKLHAAHQAIPAVDNKKPSVAAPAHPSALEEEFHRVRTALVTSISASATGSSRGAPLKTPVPSTAPDADVDAAYAPHHQRYLDQQRQMALRIDALRAYARRVLTQCSAQLGQLASFDAVMEQMFGDREQKLLSSVPVLLERRFEYWRKIRQLAPDAATQGEVFGKEMQEVLLAELEVRLQPVVGLIEAFNKELKRQA